MKKQNFFITTALLIILLSCSVSAFDLDNKKDFEKGNLKYGKITIKNSFGFGETLEELTLKENTDICSTDCYAIIEIDLKEKGALVEEVYFNYGEIKKYDFYLIENNKKKKYKIGEELEEGKYILKLEGKKNKLSSIDWVIKTKGKVLSEWALWSANITLNYPANDSIFNTNNITFNCSAVSNDSLLNISLWTNTTGSWALNETKKSGSISYCYQESTNTTNQTGIDGDCGLNYGGGYYFTNESQWTNRENIFDGDFNTYATWSIESDNDIRIFYKKPTEEVYQVNWLVKTREIPFTYLENLTLPEKCFNFSETISLKVIANKGVFVLSDKFDFYCWDNVSWEYLDSTSYVGRFYEESIYWEIFGNSSTQTFTKNISDGFYKYNCEFCDTESCAFASSNYSFTIDTSTPQININYPTPFVDYGKEGITLDLNWSVLNGALDSCWYNYNNTNTSVNCLDNHTTFNLTDQKNLTFYANDTASNLGSNFTTWDYKVFEINQTFVNETTERNLETFKANIKLKPDLSIVIASLIYNGTINTGVISSEGEDIILETSNVLTPNVTANTNFSFYWSILLSDLTIINLTTQNQTVLNLEIDNCSTFTNVRFNITSLDEEEQTLLVNTTHEIAIIIYSLDRKEVVLNFSGKFNDNPTDVCLNQNLTNTSNYSADLIIKYSAENYVNEYYNIVDYNLNKDSGILNISLYNLLFDDSTDFQLTFTGIDFLPIEDALIFVERQYISENKFKTVELPKTDSNGQTILHLVRNDIIYNIIVIKDNEIIGTFKNLIAFCDDFSIGNCKIDLNALSKDSIIFNYDSGVGIIYESPPTYNDTTKIISFSFSSSDGTSKIVSMDVERKDVFGNTSICTNTLVSSSGTLFCNIGNITDSTLYTQTSVNNEEWISSIVIIDDSAYGSIGYVFFFFLSFILILVFEKSKNGVLISMLISYAAAISMGWAIGGIIGIGSSGIWMLVITIIGLWQINKGRDI